MSCAAHSCKYENTAPLGIRCLGWELYHYDGMLRIEPKHECPAFATVADLMAHIEHCSPCIDYLGQQMIRFLIEENATAMILEQPLAINFDSQAAYVNWFRKPGTGRL